MQTTSVSTPRIVAIIEARMTSTRLPGKVLKTSCDRTMLEIMCQRLSTSNSIDEIVIATTTNSTDDILVAEALKLGVSYFRGDELNVFSRVVSAAEFSRADVVVSLTADCPLIDPQIVDACIDSFMVEGFDYFSNCHERSFPDGMDVQVIKAEVLKESFLNATRPAEFEHVTLNIRENIYKYKTGILKATGEEFWPELGITLDESHDLLVIDKIVSHFNPRTDFNCSEIVDFLRNNPAIVKLNSAVKRKGDN